MNRKEGDIKDKQLVVRCSQEMIDQLDKFAAKKSFAGAPWSRGDAARFLLQAGLGRPKGRR